MTTQNLMGIPLYLGGMLFRIQPLSVMQVLEMEKWCHHFKQELMAQEIQENLIDTVCEHAVLGAMSLYRGEKMAFENPQKVLDQFTLSELFKLYQTYQTYFGELICDSAIKQQGGHEENDTAI